MTKSSLLRSPSERKFTPPTSFPAEYVDGDGNKAVILGRGPNENLPFIGYDAKGYAATWTELGEYYLGRQSQGDLHDMPKRITAWHNVYPVVTGCGHRSRELADNYAEERRICVYRIECDEDGGSPEIFVEKVEDFKEEL